MSEQCKVACLRELDAAERSPLFNSNLEVDAERGAGGVDGGAGRRVIKLDGR